VIYVILVKKSYANNSAIIINPN
jgi:hypothetical protein